MGSNTQLNQTCNLRWPVVSFKYIAINITESDSHVDLVLERRGYLGPTSTAALEAEGLRADLEEDLTPMKRVQVFFGPGESEAIYRIKINDNLIREGIEDFIVRISWVSQAVIGHPNSSIVYIDDPEDECVLEFSDTSIEVEEDQEEALLWIQRYGDISKPADVSCITQSGGSTEAMALSDLDYEPRNTSDRILFIENQREAPCRVAIVDDEKYEEKEAFHVTLSNSSGCRIGTRTTSKVFIKPDLRDVPRFSFEKELYEVEEGMSSVEIMVKREGPDLSQKAQVVVMSQPAVESAAKVGEDYIEVEEKLVFREGEDRRSVTLTLLDDAGRPSVEGREVLHLVLRSPLGGLLGRFPSTTLAIEDTRQDAPVFSFVSPALRVEEDSSEVSAVVFRQGDLNTEASVMCFSIPGSAQHPLDYLPVHSILHFRSVDDPIYEGKEEFLLALKSPKGGSVGTRNTTILTIEDPEDRPRVSFGESQFLVVEPLEEEKERWVEVDIFRSGDLTQVLRAKVHSKDGNARAGFDYTSIFQELEFSPGQSRKTVKIQILRDSLKEEREDFRLHLASASQESEEVTIYIQDALDPDEVAFPSAPLLVSLKDYDLVGHLGMDTHVPPPGYPLVCITPCDPRHPNHRQTGTLCSREGINDSLTEFRWKVGHNGGSLRDILDPLPIAR
ncbi:unnamed protein product [Darwinula stevensoni]|uniref:Calx-beta domain-containing protein n=1 Tax=Darwinula stevensoni TaxID=69355 RepID=A0A7R8XB57_9CRUS|nr:unnamed protein product [Darwinula stevensoni]CAG0891291.1 unnamed protein product [Darwinula stevensoni]